MLTARLCMALLWLPPTAFAFAAKLPERPTWLDQQREAHTGRTVTPRLTNQGDYGLFPDRTLRWMWSGEGQHLVCSQHPDINRCYVITVPRPGIVDALPLHHAADFQSFLQRLVQPDIGGSWCEVGIRHLICEGSETELPEWSDYGPVQCFFPSSTRRYFGVFSRTTTYDYCAPPAIARAGERLMHTVFFQCQSAWHRRCTNVFHQMTYDPARYQPVRTERRGQLCGLYPVDLFGCTEFVEAETRLEPLREGDVTLWLHCDVTQVDHSATRYGDFHGEPRLRFTSSRGPSPNTRATCGLRREPHVWFFPSDGASVVASRCTGRSGHYTCPTSRAWDTREFVDVSLPFCAGFVPVSAQEVCDGPPERWANYGVASTPSPSRVEPPRTHIPDLGITGEPR